MPAKLTITLTAAAVLAGGAYLGYRSLRHDLAAGVYKQRLTQARRDYGDLRSRYNDVVKKTAVTELVVEGGALAVHIRTADGTERVIDTPYDPYDEVYLDYVVLDGRLWIRRVYDARTPPADGLLIDPLLDEIDWDALPAAHGKAIYRRLDEGRWIITVTGDGSLGLAKLNEGEEIHLTPVPEVTDYPLLDPAVEPTASPTNPTVAETLTHLWHRVSSGDAGDTR